MNEKKERKWNRWKQFHDERKKKLAHLTRNDKTKNESKKRFLDKSAVLLLVQLNTWQAAPDVMRHKPPDIITDLVKSRKVTLHFSLSRCLYVTELVLPWHREMR